MAKKRVKTLGGFYIAWVGRSDRWKENRPSSITRNVCLQRFIKRPRQDKYVSQLLSQGKMEKFLETGEHISGEIEHYIYSLTIDDLILKTGLENDFLVKELTNEILQNFRSVNNLQSSEMENTSEPAVPFQDHPNFKNRFKGLIE